MHTYAVINLCMIAMLLFALCGCHHVVRYNEAINLPTNWRSSPEFIAFKERRGNPIVSSDFDTSFVYTNIENYEDGTVSNWKIKFWRNGLAEYSRPESKDPRIYAGLWANAGEGRVDLDLFTIMGYDWEFCRMHLHIREARAFNDPLSQTKGIFPSANNDDPEPLWGRVILPHN